MILLQLLLSFAVFAAPQNNPPKDPNEVARELLNADALPRCEELLSEKPLSKHDITLITAGRETVASRKMHEEAIEELFGPKGVLTNLGITTDKETIIHFMRGQDMAAATANGRFPATHVMEGAALLQSQGGGLIYEIAIPGKHVQHSVYRDDNPFADQYSILIHVAGHNHFTHHTKYSQQREFDLNREAIELDRMLNKYYLEVDREEVTLWYQYLESLGSAQDTLDGLHKQPSDFAPDLTRSPRKALLPNDPVDNMRHPRHPTRSVLQAFLGNLPADTPPWKREVALQYEKLIRWQTSILNTKIVNEGFATFLMEMVPKHTSKNTFEFANKFANLAAGVSAPSLSNPYYLGVEGWRQIYRKFMRTSPELAGKSSLEKDKAFIAYATKEIIGKLNDHQFLRLGLTEEWVRSKRLRLTRQLNGETDVDKTPDVQPDPRIKKPAKFIVLSDDPKVIVESLIDRVARRERSIPQVILTDMNHNRTNTIRLEMNDDWSRTRPLTAASVVKTLFVFAQIMNQPVSLESTFLDTEQPEEEDEEDDNFRWWIPRPPPTYIPVRFKTTVTPNGDVQVHRIRWNDSFDIKDMPHNPFLEDTSKIKYEEIQTDEEIGVARQMKNILDGFILQLKMTARSSAIDGIAPKTSFNMQSLATQTSNQVTSGLFEHVPTAASAIAEWESYVQARSQDLFEFALKNNQLIRRGRGVSFRVLPEQPTLRFDQRAIQLLDGTRPVRPVDPLANMLKVVAPPKTADPDGNVRPHEGGPGDSFWDEDPNGQQGEGEEGEGEEGEEGDEDSDGTNPGKDGKDPRYLQVPLDKYAKALEEVVQLPNLRPKLGITRTRAVEYTSLKATQRGTLADEETFAQAYQMGYARLLSQGKTKDDIGKMKKIDIAKMGIGMMQDPDFRARDSYPIPNPDINALVTVVLDLSGSMDPAVPAARQLIYDLRAILMRKYKGIKFQFVSFDSKAHIFKSIDDFLRTDLSGGTEYSAGLKAVKDTIYPAHPAGQWDRFLVVLGDFADYAGPGSEVPQLLESLAQDSQYTAGVLFDLYNISNGELFDFFNNRSKSDEFVGFLKINPPQSYNPIMFRELFKNDAK